MNKIKIIFGILSILYILTVIVVYKFGNDSFLFNLSLPWGVFPLFLSAMMDDYPNKHWFLIGALLNPIIVLWIVVKSIINKTGKITE